jgi:hypothetical protein
MICVSVYFLLPWRSHTACLCFPLTTVGTQCHWVWFSSSSHWWVCLQVGLSMLSSSHFPSSATGRPVKGFLRVTLKHKSSFSRGSRSIFMSPLGTIGIQQGFNPLCRT